MDWKISLDRYLTTPPDDGFDGWCEDVLGNKVTDKFYNDNEKWIDEYDGQCNKCEYCGCYDGIHRTDCSFMRRYW